jgi:microcystin-dependent protein
MVSTFSTNLGLELQGTGDNSGTWGAVLNTDALNIIDLAMGGVQTLSLSNVNVNVTTTQSQNNAFRLTGTLTGNVIITWPAIGRTYFIANETSGAFSVTLKAGAGSTSVVIPQGGSGYYTLNVDNIYAPTLPGVPIAAVSAFASTTVPSGWLACNGAAVSRTTYAALFASIGTTYGAGDGSTTFNLPDLRAYFIRGWDDSRGIDTGRVFGSTQISANLAHNHTFTGDLMATHIHSFGVFSQDAGGGVAADGTGNQSATANTTPTSAGTPTGTIGSSGGTESRPINIAMQYCIKYF